VIRQTDEAKTNSKNAKVAKTSLFEPQRHGGTETSQFHHSFNAKNAKSAKTIAKDIAFIGWVRVGWGLFRCQMGVRPWKAIFGAEEASD